jgi:hypothetical protein
MPHRLSRLLALLAFFVPVLALGTGCEGDYRPRAVGPEGQISVVVDSTLWNGEVGEALKTHLAPYISTLPAPERAFDLRQVTLTEGTLSDVKARKNVVFVAALDRPSNASTFMEQRLSSDVRQAVADGETVVVDRPDLWRRSQLIYYVTAQSTDGLIRALEDAGPRMRSAFHDATLRRVERDMYDDERQYALEDTLLAHHDFRVKVQHDFQIAFDTTNFVLMRRILTKTWRNFFIYYVEDADPGMITPEWIHDTRDSLTQQYVRGNVAGYMKTDYRRTLNTDQVTFLDRYAFETQGLWHMVAQKDGEMLQMGGGGPFVNYTFYDQSSGRIYMLDGAVFAPGYDKRDFVWQMEVMARTFRTARDLDQSTENLPAALTPVR